MTQPSRDDQRTPSIQPNTLTDGGRQGQGRPIANRLAGMADVGARARLPGVSGTWSAIALLVLFVAAAVVLPLALHRSAWVEAEVVVGAWFLIMTAVLTWLGHTGRTVEEDWGQFRRPRRLFGSGVAPGNGSGALDALPYVNLGSFDFPDVGDGGDGGGLGCLGAIVAGVVAIAAVAVLLALLYFTVGYLIPLVAVALYTMVRAMLNNVAARGHVTRGNLALSFARGATWAAIYTAPLAAAIWLLHVAF